MGPSHFPYLMQAPSIHDQRWRNFSLHGRRLNGRERGKTSACRLEEFGNGGFTLKTHQFFLANYALPLVPEVYLARDFIRKYFTSFDRHRKTHKKNLLHPCRVQEKFQNASTGHIRYFVRGKFGQVSHKIIVTPMFSKSPLSRWFHATFSNFAGLKTIFEKLRVRDGLVWKEASVVWTRGLVAGSSVSNQ